MAQTDRQTDILTNGHGDSMTESAQWTGFSENNRVTLKWGQVPRNQVHDLKRLTVLVPVLCGEKRQHMKRF